MTIVVVDYWVRRNFFSLSLFLDELFPLITLLAIVISQIIVLQCNSEMTTYSILRIELLSVNEKLYVIYSSPSYIHYKFSRSTILCDILCCLFCDYSTSPTCEMVVCHAV